MRLKIDEILCLDESLGRLGDRRGDRGVTMYLRSGCVGRFVSR